MTEDNTFLYLSPFNTSFLELKEILSFHVVFGGSIVFHCVKHVLCLCVFTGKRTTLSSNLMNQKLKNHLEMMLKYVVSSLGYFYRRNQIKLTKYGADITRKFPL